VELRWLERGAGPPFLCLHETAAAAAIWEPLIETMGGDASLIAPDRRGWGESGAPEQYAATTIEEQAGDAASLLEALAADPAIVCGSGLGAVAALELLLRRRDLARGGLLIEPPLLAYLPEATEGLAADREAIRAAVQSGGPKEAMDLYLRGGLPHLGPGAERIPEAVGEVARRSPGSLFAELGAVPAWSLRTAEMVGLESPTRIVLCPSTPALLRAAAEQLSVRLGSTKLVDVGGDGLPHVTAAPDLARLVRELLDSAALTRG
jgi:pimeloyl-ACP methyl ester carboxylesterase